MDNLGQAYQAAGEADKAFSMFQQAVAGLEKLDFQHTEAGPIVGNLCNCLEQRKQFDRADYWRQKWLAAAKKRNGPNLAAIAGDLAEQAEDMLERGRHESAATILVDCVAILARKQPDAWTKFRAQSLLGVALVGQQKYAEAEPLLISGYEGLKAREPQIPPPLGPHRVAEAGERIVRLYEAWGRPKLADEWRTKLRNTNSAKPHG
jgi:hypothetical protein